MVTSSFPSSRRSCRASAGWSARSFLWLFAEASAERNPDWRFAGWMPSPAGGSCDRTSGPPLQKLQELTHERMVIVPRPGGDKVAGNDDLLIDIGGAGPFRVETALADG